MIYANIHMDGHQKNSMFTPKGGIHGHSPAYTTMLLRDEFIRRGIELNTPDVNLNREIAFDLIFEGREFVDDGVPKYLVALENPYINRLNEDKEHCRRYAGAFAWDARLYELPNVVPIMYPHNIYIEPHVPLEQRDIFSCLINANKAFRDPPECDLYRERLKTIRWYERNAPGHFQLYGMGWEKPTPAFDPWGKIRRSFASLRVKLHGYKPFPSYRGMVRDKNDVMRRCRFAYCYENTRGPDNYITEKIFDSLICGCVPVYWGPKNVLDYIPSDCFIDRSAFKGTAEVHQYLVSVTAEQYADYQSNIARFIGSEGAKHFSSERFVSIVVERIVADINARE